VSALAAAVRGRTRRAGDLSTRLDGLEAAVDAASGRLDLPAVDDAAAVLRRAGQRLRLPGDHTVVGLAGSTGSGKSSLFNAVCGIELASVGVRRPTTSWALACVWGSEDASELLEWLGIPPRNQVSRASALDPGQPDADLDGLVLLDLPDHDSVEVSHHLEVERLVELIDVLVWVVDPQKYADAAVHDRFLKPLASHADVMLLVLNHVDELSRAARDTCLGDLRRLLVADGLRSVPILATSAITGEGLPELRQAVADRVAAKRAARQRLGADITRAALALQGADGDDSPEGVARKSETALTGTFAEAAGVPVVVRAVRNATRTRARQATGWPVTKWLARLRPDPLRRLHLDRTPGSESVLPGRASLPAPSPVQRARVDTEVRRVVDASTQGMSKPWADAVRRASVSRLEDLSDELDRAVTGTDLGVARTPIWWRVVRAVQWALFAVAVAGCLWLAVLAVMGYFRLPEPTTPQWYYVPAPTFLVLAGAVAGLLLALLSRFGASLGSKRRARQVDRRLRHAIAEVTERLVVQPIEVELDAYRRFRAGLGAALRR
jgi:GTP-binding protein EngB required for normal cell division